MVVGLPAGPTARGAATSWRVYRSCYRIGMGPPAGRGLAFLCSPEAAFLFFGGLEGLEGAGCGRGGGFAPVGFGAFEVVAVENLQGQFAVGFGSAGLWVVESDGFAVAGSFGQPDVAGDSGLEKLVF